MYIALFGPAGSSDSFSVSHKSSLDMPAWLAERNLDAFEYQCGNGVRISQKTATELGKKASENGIRMSLHSPYYISLTNLNNIDKNINYAIQSANAAKAMGANRIVVHTGSATGRPRQEALDDAAVSLKEMLSAMDDAGLGDIIICPETMGKINQLGDLDEVLELCVRNERLIPCIDFGHLYARSLGAIEGYEATAQLFDKLENKLGLERAKNFHAHFSKIEYSKGGEKQHTVFSNAAFGPDFNPVARLIAERGYSPTIIRESSGTQAEDAAEMKRMYLEALKDINK